MKAYDLFGYALAMAVLQSDLYHKLDDKAKAECDELITTAQQYEALSCASKSQNNYG